jgi:Ser/Thr protein kinase RdoA (MazF antagonist)
VTWRLLVNPIKNGTSSAEMHNRLQVVCSRAGLSASGAQLLHHYANAVWLLPTHPAIVRISDSALVHAKATTNVAVCQWLVDQHQFPATAPLSTDVIILDGHTAATLWTYYPQLANLSPTPAQLGGLLRRLHALAPTPVELPTWRALTSLELVLRDTTRPSAINDSERQWLLDRIDQVRHELAQLDWPLGYGLIHGDAWAGNLLWQTATNPPTVLLGDWDSTSWGPREIDLIPTWHAAIRFGRGQRWADAFAAEYGYDLTRWSGFSTLFAMRDLVQLVALLRRVPDQPGLAGALRQRLDGIKAGDTKTVWQAY